MQFIFTVYSLKYDGQIERFQGPKTVQIGETFRALKLSNLANKFQGQKMAETGEFYGPKTVQFGEFQAPKRLQSGQCTLGP